MACAWFRTGVIVFILYIDLVSSMEIFTPQTSKIPDFRKLAVDSSGRNIYVGGKNIIYHLNEDLTQVGVVQTGPHNDSKECTKEEIDIKKSGCNIQLYDDYTQLLQVYEPGGILVTCGTLYLGRCVGRNLRNISIVNITSTSYLSVSADETGSTESVIANVGTESVLFVGKSYFKTTEQLEVIYTQGRVIIYGGHLQENKFMDPYETESVGQTTFSIKTVNSHADQKYDFVIKDMFEMSDFNNFIYSLVRIMDQTTQKTVSKVSKICGMATPSVNSYEDMPIKCSEFPYVQDGLVIQHGSGKVLVTLFSSGVDVTETTPCAVCVFTEDELLEGFVTSRMNPPSCGNADEYPVDYLEPKNERKCCSSLGENCDLFNSTTYCGELEASYSFIGVIPIEASPVYHGTGLVSLGGTFKNDLTTILVGTQNGIVHKLFLKSSKEANLLKSTNYLVDPVQPIIHIETTELDRTYLLGRYSVALLDPPGDCHEKKTCTECMEIADSKCGWCLQDGGSCIEKASCSADGFWLPSLGRKCLTLHTNPAGIRHQNTASITNVTVFLSPPVQLRGNDVWQCQYGSDECKPGQIPCRSALTISETTMICPIEAREAFQKEYKLADFKIVKKYEPSYVLAEGWSLLFYKCSAFKSCFECVTNPKARSCFWNTNAAKCLNTKETSIEYDESSKCPQLSKMQIKLHQEKETTVVIQAENLVSEPVAQYKCYLSDREGSVTEVNRTAVSCLVKVSAPGSVNVTYRNTILDHNGTVNFSVYRCEDLTKDCSSCVFLNTQGYQCYWDLTNNKCSYSLTATTDSSKCPAPSITMISPRNGTISGRTILTIHGKELASTLADINITVSGRQCEILNYSFSSPQWIQCYTIMKDTETRGGQVIVTRNGKNSNTNWTFDYLVPQLLSLDPVNGIKDGGRILTLKGSNLLLGNRQHMTVELFNKYENIPCNIIPFQHVQKKNSEVICIVGRYSGKQLPFRLTGVNVTYDDNSHVLSKPNINFTFVDNPRIKIGRLQAIRSGGIDMNITGERFQVVSVIRVNNVLCKVVSDTKVTCPTPAYNLSQRRRRRRNSNSCPCHQYSTLHMDNYNYLFNMEFTENPTIISFDDIVNYEAGTYLAIEGNDLLRGAVASDYSVKVQSTDCHDVKVNENGTLITFKPPDFLSTGNEYQVEVFVGISYRQHVGVIYYKKDVTTIIIIAAFCGAFAAMLVVVIFCVIRSRRKDSQLNKLKTDIVEMESNIRNKSREVFADMQMSMQDIKGDLVTTGIPYFDYHNYSFHTLFPKLKAGESIYYQASASHQGEEFARLAPRGLVVFDELLKNKFFLQSLIGTLERQNKFSVPEKAEFSSLLTLILMGKMTYLSEVIEELLNRLISGASRKQHRVLFRRSDSITQKLLSNWLALSLYSYLKGGGGQQLFMLYKASQTVMEKGPIDAVTLEAKDTLAEERLLKMDLQYESLTLEVDLNGKKELRYSCTVLDCDTITQVKAKCMYKIYKNKPASELQFTPEDLVLEWHAGKGGKLVLNDIDRTSTKREGYVCRNTLKHYNVKDGNSMALLISDDIDDQELYYNSEATSMNDVLLSEHSMTSYMSMSPEKQWHMVFPEEDEKESRRQLVIEELYLNRLLHTKLTLMEYIDAVLDNMLDEKRVPPVVCYLFKMFETIAKEHNVDPDIVSCWKSECYAMRIWSLWISRPDLLFDIILAEHVTPCLDVIKSMFSDVFSRTDAKLSKDSSSAKLLFANEVPKFQEKMRNFYDKVGSSCEPVTKQKFVSLMEEISQQQTQEIRVKKLPALKKLFAMVKTFSDEIIADLDEARETRDLKLGEKFDNVIQQMDMENV